MQRIKKDDTVMVRVGKDRGKTGKVIRVFPAERTALVQNINLVKKAVKKSDQYPQGGYVEVERPVSLANVMLVEPASGKPVRTRFNVLKDGTKVRVGRKSGQTI